VSTLESSLVFLVIVSYFFKKYFPYSSYIFIIFPFFGQSVRRRRTAPGAGGFMAQLLAELRGAAEAAEVPLQALCSLSLQYEATTLVVYRGRSSNIYKDQTYPKMYYIILHRFFESHLFLDVFTFSFNKTCVETSQAYCACTALAARLEDGSIALARTLDWEFPQLKAI
jgi:hypothetical protein